MPVQVSGSKYETISITGAQTVTLPFDSTRVNLAIKPATACTITFVDSGASIELTSGEAYAPVPAPINEITVTGEGTFIQTASSLPMVVT